MKDQKGNLRFWYIIMAVMTLLLLLPVAWYSYLKPGVELTKLISATDDGAALDVPPTATFPVDALVESAVAKYLQGGQNVRTVLLENRDRMLRNGILILLGGVVLMGAEFIAIQRAGRTEIPTSSCS